jgi:phosphopantothenoylcysteine decarboxylase/phosphopantothenate--cysteine ligase
MERQRVTRIILGITGGIAAYKMPQLVRLLQKDGIDVTAVLTPNAKGLVGEEALRVVSRRPAYCGDRPAEGSHEMAHIELAKWAQFLLVCPASANTIAKLAHGICDNLLTTLALSFENRLMIAPAMNTNMWLNKSTRANIQTLASRGVMVLPVDSGELACGDEGPGRLLALESIVDFVRSACSPRLLLGKKVLISSGPTMEPVDAVRVITNRSSGKMGAALARAALAGGADVTVVTGPSRIPPPSGCRTVCVETALEMKAALEAEFDKSDICIMAAAVGDFRPVKPLPGKKHRDDGAPWSIECTPNPDIAAALGAKKTRQFLVGFSLDAQGAQSAQSAQSAGKDLGRARKKMAAKNCDMMVVNTAASVESDSTTATVLFPRGKDENIAEGTKQEAAEKIVRLIVRRMKE